MKRIPKINRPFQPKDFENFINFIAIMVSGDWTNQNPKQYKFNKPKTKL